MKLFFGMAGAAVIFLLSACAALAYSIYPSPETPQSAGTSVVENTNVSGTINFKNAWNELSPPFEGFFTSIQNITPAETQVQLQVQSFLPPGGNNPLIPILNFLSWSVNGLVGISDQIAVWVISWLHAPAH